MTDTSTQGAAPAARKPDQSDRFSTPAIISYVILSIFAGTIFQVFELIRWRVGISPEMLGVLGGLIGVETTGVAGVTGFWIGASAGGKAANAALAQLAGAGPQPPNVPKA